MRLEGSVAGRQFDRIGYVDVGDVRMLTLSTPEPSPQGISWHVEKDVTELAPLLGDPQQVQAFIGNVVDSTYTGVIHVAVDLDFYTTGRDAPAATVPDAVLPLAGTSRERTDLDGSLTVPRNSMRLLADVFATGSGGGCEEFWDTSAPASTGYSCPDGLPYREVDVRIARRAPLGGGPACGTRGLDALAAFACGATPAAASSPGPQGRPQAGTLWWTAR